MPLNIPQEVSMNRIIIGWVIFLIVQYLVLFFLFDFRPKTEGKEYVNRIEQLEQDNQQLKTENDQLGNKIYGLQQTTNQLNQTMLIVKEKQEQIKVQRDEKISNIDTMDNHQLFHFFANFETKHSNH